MKAIFILVNWALSLMSLCIDTERSPLWASLLCVVWFAASSLLLKYADRKGWLDKICKTFKIDEL